MINIISEIPSILKSLRKERGLTQEQVSKKIGVDRSTYAYYESGRITPDIKMILLLSNVYDVNYTTILDSDAALVCSDASKDMGFSSPCCKKNSSDKDEISEEEKSILMSLRLLSKDSQMEVIKVISKKVQEETRIKKHKIPRI